MAAAADGDELAARIARLTPEQRALFQQLKERQAAEARARLAAGAVAGAGHAPPPILRRSGPTGEGDWQLSLDQERFWFMEQLYANRAGLNITAATRMRGRLLVPLLAAALAGIERRHAAWRTTFPQSGGHPVQRVAPPPRSPADALRLPVTDLGALPAARRDGEVERLVRRDSAAPFDLEHGPLVRASLLRLAPADHVCVLTVHHMVTDWVSAQLAWGELAAGYQALAEGRAPALPTPAVQYPDFALWQREWLQGEVLAGLVSWWRERLAEVPLVLDLPTDRPRPPVARMRGARRTFALPPELAVALRATARGHGATLFMTVLAVAAGVLHRDSGQEQLILGSNNANRNRPELAAVFGCFLTQVPFVVDLRGDPEWRALLGRVRASALGAFVHQDLPFGKLVEALQLRRDLSRQPLVQALVQVLDGQYSKVELAGVGFDSVDAHDGRARYDLMLSLTDFGDTVACSVEYDADLFDGSTMAAWVERFLLHAGAAAADPARRIGALPPFGEAVRHQVTVEWNDAPEPGPLELLPHRIAAHAACTPDALAVESPSAALTYAGLRERAAVLARRLRRQGAGRGSLVALALGRGTDLPAAILGVWQAGAAFVTIDPAAPARRLAWLLADAAPAALVHRGPLPEGLAEGAAGRALDLAALDGGAGDSDGAGGAGEEAAPGAVIDAADLAYVLYTSGTTGQPKAAMIEHGGLAAILAGVGALCGLRPGDRMAQMARPSFDAALLEIFLALLAGAAVDVVAEDDLLDPARQAELLARCASIFAVPALLRSLAATARTMGAARCRTVRCVVSGGEAVAADVRREVLEAFPAASMQVQYGPTEASIVATAHRVERGPQAEQLLIGRPLPGVELRVVEARSGAADGPTPPQHGEAEFHHGLLAPLGAPGELWVGGAGVGRGYHRRDELTAERFVRVDGRRFYRSGDLVRWLPARGGVLEFLGRLDFQVKVRGVRIEPAEIEAALAEHPAVGEAVVVARPDGAGGNRLVAYWVPAEGVAAAGAPGTPAAPSNIALRLHLAERLPEAYLPAAWVALAEMPRNAHGKLDRARLPAPEEAAEPAGTETGEAPAGPAEEIVAGIWCEVLSRRRVERHANFFELGGHSLLATQVVSRLRAATGAELPVRALFQAPTVAALGALVAGALAGGAAASDAPPLGRAPRDRPLPLSFAQERLWFLDRLAPGSAAYNIPLALAAHGELSLPALAAALGEMVRRHEALRTRFDAAAPAGGPVQVVEPAAGPGARRLPLADLSALPAGSRGVEARRLADAEVGRGFDLARGPLLRSLALRLGPAEHVLLLVVHHIAADGWSVGVMVREIAALYPAALAGWRSPLPELAVQYADFAVWQRGWLCGEALERQLAYWRRALGGAPALALPLDRPRPAAPGFRGATRMHRLAPAAAAGARELARRGDATLFMALLAAVQALLGRYAGQEDVVVGSPIANRHRAELEPMVGFFVNSLVLRGDLAGDPSFAELLARTRRTALDAYAHQDLPFERLVEELRPQRRLAENPLFQVMCAVQNTPLGEMALPGLRFTPVELTFPATRFDFEIHFRDTIADGGSAAVEPASLSVQLTFSTDLFEAATMVRLLGHLEALLAAAAADPARRLAQLPILAAGERHQLLWEWNDTRTEVPRAEVAALFFGEARRRPDAVALRTVAGVVSYGELARRAVRLGVRLAAAGVGPEVRVALLARRTPPAIEGMLGILAAGGAYVPLDPGHPAARQAFVLANAGCSVLLAPRELAMALPEEVRAAVPWLALDDLLDDWDGGDGGDAGVALPAGTDSPVAAAAPDGWAAWWEAWSAGRRAGPDGLLYVMYTSGSTGEPKGVGIAQRGVVRLVRGGGFARLGPGEVFLQLAPLAFDAATFEVWGALLHGGSLALLPPECERRPSLRDVGEAVTRHGVTTLWLTAGLFHQVVDAELGALAPLSQLLAGGDVLSPEHVRRALAGLPRTVVVNGYGPTEATTFTACQLLRAAAEVGESVALGRPIANTRVHVLGRRGEVLSAGAWGELWVGGEGLARGYLGRPAPTAESFAPDPFASEGEPAGARLYRTGDVVRRLADGRLEFRGRRDGQVKLRGYRIELGEVESALLRHPRVAAAAVVLARRPPARGPEGREGGEDEEGVESAAGEGRLVAYVVARPPETAVGGGGAAGGGEPAADGEPAVVGESAAAAPDLAVELRRALAAVLPEPMVPSLILTLDSLPLTGSGKIDRAALPAPEGPGEPAASYVAPANPLEELLAGLAAEVLGVERAGMRDNFFALGGHSLLATQLVSRLAQGHGLPVTLQMVFDAADLGELADLIMQREIEDADEATIGEALRDLEDVLR